MDDLRAGRELDAACARAMGQTDFTHPGFFWEEGTMDDGKDRWSGFYCPRCHTSEARKDRPCVRCYSTNSVAARLLEDEIERRGMRLIYIHALLQTALSSFRGQNTGSDLHWALIRATPEQRARAFLDAVGTG